MKTRLNRRWTQRSAHRGWAFSLVEVMIAMSVIGISVGALLTGVSSSMFTMRMARENLRATQIMLEKVETLRLYTWDQLNNPSFFTNTSVYRTTADGQTNFYSMFREQYDPNSANSKGLTYNGWFVTYDPRSFGIDTSYSTNNMMGIWVSIYWYTGKTYRTRSLMTLVTRNGLQDYVYGW